MHGCSSRTLRRLTLPYLAPTPPQLSSLRRILQAGHYPPNLLPPDVLNPFLDAFDTLLGARARMALRITASPQLRQAPQHAELALTPAHVSALCWALAGIPGASLT